MSCSTNLATNKLLSSVIGDPCHVTIILSQVQQAIAGRYLKHLNVKVVADLDAPAVGSIDELTKDITLAVAPLGGFDRVIGKVAWPQSKPALGQKLRTEITREPDLRGEL